MSTFRVYAAVILSLLCVGATSVAVLIPNASFEKPEGFGIENIAGWTGDHQPEHGNAWGTIPQDQLGAPATPYGRQWAFISSDGFKDPVSIWTAVGTVEDNREYQFSFLAGKCDTDEYKSGHHYEVSIWAGDSHGPQEKLAAKSFSDPDQGKTKECSVKLNSDTGHAGQVLYLMFSKPYENEWSQILIDDIWDISPEALARREARKADEIARVKSVLEKVSRNPQGKVVGITAVEPVDVDWLIRPVTRPAELLVCPGKDKAKSALILTNGLISRSFRLLPNAATVGFDNLMTGESILRGVKPEAIVELDGVKYEVGGLQGQVEYAYLRPEWVDVMAGNPDAFQFTSYRLGKIEARFPWKRKRYCADLAWPPRGQTLTLDFEPPASILEGITLSVHYSIYEGIPLLSKWFTLHNGTGKAVRLNSFVSEILAAVEYETQEYEVKDWAYPNMHVESDYAFYASSPKAAKRTTTHWLADPQYTTIQNSKLPTLLESRPPIGPDQLIEPGGDFESFRTFELIYDSTDRERSGLALRRMYRTIAPWVTENPILMHVRSADSASVRKAIDQCAEVGFEMVIMTFGSGVNLESEDAEYIARVKADADYAHSKGVDLGGYSLLASRSAGPEHDCINPENGKPGGGRWGHCPCLESRWGQDYFGKLENMFQKTGMDILEHDGNYPGDLCASTDHPGHRGLEDSQWNQWRKITDFYKWCRARGIYLNVPDWYFLTGSNKIHMNYKEGNNSLPRERQIILNRQNIFDGTWYKPPSMGWMFLPLVEYQGGGAAATIEPLHEHLDVYEWNLAQNFGSGVQACYRGPRLYDTDATKAVVKKWVDFYKKYRAILDSDIIHIRRPDGRDIDCIMHVNPQLKQKGLAMIYNPTNLKINRKLRLPLYYTGLTEKALIREQDGPPREYTLDREYNVNISIDMLPNSYNWFVIEEPSIIRDKQENTANNTDWFHEARLGIMASYLADPLAASGGGEGKDFVLGSDEWNRQIDAFDVKGLADQLEEIGVKYYLISIGQNSGHYCSPNATYDKIVGITPSKCSRRDLIADLSRELETRGIMLMVYLPSGAPAADPIAAKKLKWRWGRVGGWPGGGERTGERLVEFQRNWEAVIREWSLRWGRHVAGWWIDGCYFADEMYRFADSPNFASFATALKAGNPDAIITFNKPGQSHSEYEDYTAGELWIKSNEVSVCPGRWIDCQGKKIQYHTLTYLGAGWGIGDMPRYSTNDLIKYTRCVTDGGGVITWDVPFEKNGLIKPGFVEPLKTLCDALKKSKKDSSALMK